MEDYVYQAWPAWFYGPDGAAEIFECAEDVPAGWVDHPSKVADAPQPEPEPEPVEEREPTEEEVSADENVLADEPEAVVEDEPVRRGRGRPRKEETPEGSEF